MNLFTDYQRKIFASLKSMEKKGIISNLAIDLRPLVISEISCTLPSFLLLEEAEINCK